MLSAAHPSQAGVRAYGTLTFRENFYLITAVIFVSMIGLHFVIRWSKTIESQSPRHVVETGALALAGFFVFIFLRPVEQFIHFQF